MTDDQALYAEDRAIREAASDGPAFWRTFRRGTARVNGGLRIHYVVGGGEGEPVVLLHGFPQNWREWRLIMPALAGAGHAVIAPDLRGFGDSDRPLSGYDVATVGEDIRLLAEGLGHGRVNLVGHDLGASVAYAWAAAHPEGVRRLVMMDALPAGLEPPAAPPPFWHHGFLQTPDLPEVLVAGKERAFLSYFFSLAEDPMAFSEEDIDGYVRTFAATGGMRGAASHLRARPGSVARNRALAERGKLEMPVLAIGASGTFGASMEEGARLFAEDVTGAVALGSGHWIPEERPAWLAEQLLGFFGDGSG